MKAVVTRVNSASVSISGEVVGSIGRGFLILLGVGPEDTPALCTKLAEKVLGLRVFRDENDKMNRSLADVGGSVLVVSQFTLYGDARHGNRPSYIEAQAPELAKPLYEYAVKKLTDAGVTVRTGVFRTEMLVEIHNDGPITILLDSNKTF